MKIALMRVLGHNCYECGNEPAKLVTDWAEVSEVEYQLLQGYIRTKWEDNEAVLLLHEPYEPAAIESTVQEAIAYQTKHEAQQRKYEKEREAKRRERARRKKEETKKEREKLFKELKEEFGAQ